MAIISKEKIASEANILLGGDPISDLDTDTREAEVMSNLIDFVFESLISSTAWNFAIADQQISIEATTPADKRYDYQGQLPLNYQRVISVYDAGGTPTDNYSILSDGTKINTNINEVFIKYTYLPTTYNFPGYFRDAFVHALASAAAEPITGITTLGTRIDGLATKKFKLAKILDGQGDSVSSYWDEQGSVTGGRH